MMKYFLNRFIAFCIDLMSLALISILLDLIPFFHSNENTIYLVGTIFLFKDLFFNRRSLGKKIMNLEIHFNSYLSLIFRNISLFIWPIECILVLVTKRRLGDMLFKTDVVPATAKEK